MATAETVQQLRTPLLGERALAWRTGHWGTRYRAILRVTDTAVVVASVFGGTALWARLSGSTLGETYVASCTALVVLWLGALVLFDTRSERVTGVGMAEFKRVWDASIALSAGIAFVVVLAPHVASPGTVIVTLPLGLTALLVTRVLWREWLKARRRTGEWCTRVLLVGSAESVDHIRGELSRAPSAGFRVVGVCTASDGVDVKTGAIMAALDSTGADTVIVTSTDDLPPAKVKEISWSLEQGRHHLLLAPNITDVAGPRIHTRPAAGLPLIHVETPRLGRLQTLAKRVFDVLGAATLIVLLTPVFVVLALLVRSSSPGPVLYRQLRIGQHGEVFPMLKFRSMRVGADAELAGLLEAQGTGQTPLFKVKDDPRITPIGKVLRKFSLDELPQLFNVLGGTMSLVGPRPQVEAEVALYTSVARRRLLTRPGITGLWQVSGRSELDWEQAVRLDLYYVENWSMFTDLVILARTVKAVVAPGESAH
ncbi:sugar transferase [Demequina sp.]|uniref:sugar transferase n=1 Tax=Demequina sp. TaxID=2050685 RepID=UPI003A8480BC